MSASVAPASPRAELPGTLGSGDPSSPCAKGRILVVEDDPSILELMRRLLEAKGYEVACADDGHRAHAILLERRFDLVISDINLPGMTGIELLQRTHALDADLPVILVTAGPTLESAIEAVEHGALRYLQKPLDIPATLEAVQTAVRYSRLSRLEGHALRLARAHHGVEPSTDLEARFEDQIAQLHMVFQPIVDWSEHRVHAYEALARSHSPSFRSPITLFDTAVALDQSKRLGRKVRALSAEAMARAPGGTRLFLNLTSRDLVDDELYEDDTPLGRIAERVVLEITERESLVGVPGLRDRVAELRGLGYRIAIDDLGAGYAGLETFAVLEPDVVKLDMSLVRDIHLAPTKARLVRHLVGAARELGSVVVAEGVEIREERDTLLGVGCELFQGYLFARPGPPFPLAQADSVAPPDGPLSRPPRESQTFLRVG